jgi:tetratricopeptide (TPR) repeat protein
MLNHAAEQSFQNGLDALASRKPREAFAFFSGALEIERRNGGAAHLQARYVSYYGLTLATVRGDLHEAVRCCRNAVKVEGYRPDLCWNLGRVALKAGRRREAYRALLRAARLQPDHHGIRRDLERMGRRRRPVLPFLPRSNRLNVFLGRLLAAC